MSQTPKNCNRITVFYEVGEMLYFTTIAASSVGCDLYAWDKDGCEIHACAHFSGAFMTSPGMAVTSFSPLPPIPRVSSPTT